MSRVRVRLRTDKVRLSFEGGRELFERQIEPLLLGLARGGRRTPAAVRAPTAARAPTVARAPKASAPAVAASAPARTGYVPPSGSFGTFQRQLDPARDGTEQQIAAFAFFLWNYEKKEVFREEEILGCFAADGGVPPGDVGALYERLERRRILERAGDEAWRLTGKGLSRVRKSLR